MRAYGEHMGKVRSKQRERQAAKRECAAGAVDASLRIKQQPKVAVPLIQDVDAVHG